MAIIQTISYKCDVCKKNFKNEKDITSTNIPCYGGERNEYLSNAQVDLCTNCAKKLRSVIYKNFAEISEWYGTRITKKFDDEDKII